MHIILGALGAAITILVLINQLNRAGIDIGWLNPFWWYRRRNWRKKITLDPIYSLETPLDATALLMAAVAKADGDMTANEKNRILELYQSEFHLSERDASGLLGSRVYLLKDGQAVRDDLDKVLSPSLEQFTAEQAESAIQLLEDVAACDSAPSPQQTALIEQVRSILAPRLAPRGKWGGQTA